MMHYAEPVRMVVGVQVGGVRVFVCVREGLWMRGGLRDGDREMGRGGVKKYVLVSVKKISKSSWTKNTTGNSKRNNSKRKCHKKT